jgi:hypothetical protein
MKYKVGDILWIVDFTVDRTPPVTFTDTDGEVWVKLNTKHTYAYQAFEAKVVGTHQHVFEGRELFADSPDLEDVYNYYPNEYALQLLDNGVIKCFTEEELTEEDSFVFETKEYAEAHAENLNKLR